MGAIKILEDIEKKSNTKIRQIAQALNDIASDEWSLIVNGSFARREVTRSSDFDFFILHKPTADSASIKEAIKRTKEASREFDIKLPSNDGVFGQEYDGDQIANNIGGEDDTNGKITRRVLFLLEGHAITGAKLFNEHRQALIERYIQENISDHQLGLFLLNDFIRYYRTVCVDFEFKTFEGKKPWGIRNIKLIFSRKLMYFSGVLMIAETAQRSLKLKREIIAEFANLTPIQRFQKACGSSANRALESYSKFLSALDNDKIRKALEATTKERHKEFEIFRDLKDEGQHFSAHLLSALQTTYPQSHPIHRALVL